MFYNWGTMTKTMTKTKTLAAFIILAMFPKNVRALENDGNCAENFYTVTLLCYNKT